jgi:hypothetical protein
VATFQNGTQIPGNSIDVLKIIQVPRRPAEVNVEGFIRAPISREKERKTMQAAAINSTAAISELTGTLAAITQVTTNGRSQTAVVERTSSGYEAYVPDQPGPVATGSSIDIAELRLDSTVQFQA